METLLKTFGDSAAAMKSTATTLSAAANHTSQWRTSAVAASQRRLERRQRRRPTPPTNWSVRLPRSRARSRRPTLWCGMAVDEAHSTDGEMNDARRNRRRRSATSSSSSRPSPSRPTFWRSTPRSKRRAPARRGAALRWLPRRSNRWRCRPARRRKRSSDRYWRCRARPRAPWNSIRRITQRMQEIAHYATGVAASIEEQSAATSHISSNVASAAQATQSMGTVLDDVAGAATQDLHVGGSRARRLALGGSSHRRSPRPRRSLPGRRRGVALRPRPLVLASLRAKTRSRRRCGPLCASAACAAARRAIGTRNGEQDT